jgi:hypothetical protein
VTWCDEGTERTDNCAARGMVCVTPPNSAARDGAGAGCVAEAGPSSCFGFSDEGVGRVGDDGSTGRFACVHGRAYLAPCLNCRDAQVVVCGP